VSGVASSPGSSLRPRSTHRLALVALLVVLPLGPGCVDLIPDPPEGGGSLDDDDATLDDDDTTLDDDDSTADDDDTGSDDDDITLDDDDSTADDDDATVDPGPCPCAFGQLCTGLSCVWAPTFVVGMLEASSDGQPYAASAAGCFYTPEYLGGTVVALADPCQVRVLEADEVPEPYFPADAGTVQISGGVLDPVAFTASSPVECLANNVSLSVDLFEPGQALHFEGSGGADFPAFTADVIAPEPIVGAPGILSIGSDLTMAWSASTAPSVELVLSASDSVSGDAYLVVCRVPDTGGYVIPGAMTAWLPVSNDGVSVAFVRDSSEHLEFVGSGLVIEAAVQTNWTLDLP